ncbi:C-type lectin domain family 7 member A-like isoform X1 [Mauremys reevesii]|uniref:C-type lectin domain family 7 member A-like isoform X1 n=2 Tax=Mauremys reevesii TaxID=260615 RepID=UPI00193F4A1E|nr:C-type lectin domain family 7 member A-like isoform X1 [Mauremys reevesii]
MGCHRAVPPLLGAARGWHQVRLSPAGGFSYLQTPMPVQQRKVKGTPSDINVIYESKDEGKANAQAGPAAVIAVSPSASPWRLSAIILGPICLILLILVIVMAQQVYQLSQKSEQQLEVIDLENIILSDTLQQLTTGKEDNCSMCEVDWDQQAASCYSFSTSAKSWHNSLDACTAISASLVKIDTKKELEFLKHEISKRMYVRQGQQFHFNFWTGLNYDNDIGNWTWADGSPFSFQLFQVPGAEGCAYMQKGDIRTQSCAKWEVYICEKPAKFGGN